MGDTRGTRTRVAALVVVLAAGLLTAVAGSPAHAAFDYPEQCVEARSGQTVTIEDYPAARVVDLDIGVDWRYDSGELALVNGEPGAPYPPQRRVLSSGYRFEYDVRYVTFDNEAELRYPEMPPPGVSEVRYRPAQQIPAGSSDVPTWYVQLDRQPSPQVYFTATITWSDCDADHDGLGDRTSDNCPGVSTPDRRDRDGDGIGDACDPDNDNDGVADGSDNCPAVANSDQTDWDLDGIGNACDSTPGAAPATPAPAPTPTPTPPPTATPTPTSPPPAGTSVCSSSCAYVRTVGLRHQSRKHRLTGRVESIAVGCVDSVPVTIWKERSGQDRKLVVVTTRAAGTFRTKAPRKPGRYYATVGSAAEPLCGNDQSRTVRVTRR